MNKHYLLITAVVIIALIILWLYLRYKPTKVDLIPPYSTTSLTLSELSNYLTQRLEFIKDNSRKLSPYDEVKFDMMSKTLLDSAASGYLDGVVLSSTLLPNSSMGNIPIEPSFKDPLELTTFQYGQGYAGWYFLYGTFINGTKDSLNVANYFFYLLRSEIIPDDLRKTLNLKPGQGTYYNIVGGVGINGQWSYSPFMVCRATYNVMTETTFSFEALDLPEGWECSFGSQYTGNFNLNMKWPSNTHDEITHPQSTGFTTTLQSIRPPFYDNPRGCMPCLSGAGTLYFSFTEMVTDATLTLPNKAPESFKNGTGWIDRQWLNTSIVGGSLKIVDNILNTFATRSKGLGRYLWYNLHISPNLQYMATCLPTRDVKKGDKLDCTYNRYGDETVWGIKGHAVIEDTVDIKDPLTGNPITFPTMVAFYIPSDMSNSDGESINTFNDSDNTSNNVSEIVYHLDTTPFGNNLTVDFTNNIHWTGSALLWSDSNGQKGSLIGTGFAEANQLQDVDTYDLNIMSKINLPPDLLEKFKDKPSKLSETWPSFVLASLFIILSVLLVKYGWKTTKSIWRQS